MAKLEEWLAKLEGWLAKLIATPAYHGKVSGFESTHP